MNKEINIGEEKKESENILRRKFKYFLINSMNKSIEEKVDSFIRELEYSVGDLNEIITKFLKASIDIKNCSGIDLVAVFNNEETKQGQKISLELYKKSELEEKKDIVLDPEKIAFLRKHSSVTLNVNNEFY